MTLEQQRQIIRDFLEEQYIISDSHELDKWLAHLARNERMNDLAEVIENELS